MKIIQRRAIKIVQRLAGLSYEQRQSNTDAEPVPARCLSPPAGVGEGKAGSVFHHSSLISTQKWYVHGPQRQQHLVREWACSKVAAGPLEMRVEKQEQKREEARKIQILELRFVSLAPLKPLVWGAKSGGNENPGCREGRLKPRSWLGGQPRI